MKLSLILLLTIVIVAVTAGEIKDQKPPSGDEVTPQWSCPKLNLENAKAKEAKVTTTKCEYIEYLIEEFKGQYNVPNYPSCYAQMDSKCTDKVGSYYEKKNIKIFSKSLVVFCQSGGNWDDFATLLDTFRTKFAEAFATEYWDCISDEVATLVEAEYVVFPTFPAPYLDVLNYVCQGLESQLRNAERIQFQDFFDSNDGFKVLTTLGKPLWEDMEAKVGDADLSADLKACFTQEISYFHSSTVPEVEGAYNVNETSEDEYDQAYLWVDEDEEIAAGAPFDEDEEGYECWNYYAPRKHYHSDSAVNEDAFDGNRGHPLCGPNTIYEPISYYGPICCPIHPVDFKPHTFNCCFESLDLPQIKGRRNRPMRKSAACYGCTCLDGYEMDTKGDFWGLGDDYGACVKKVYGDDEE